MRCASIVAMRRRGAILAIATLPFTLAARNREWRDGQLMGVEMKDFMTGKKNNHLEHRYLCAVSDGKLIYMVELEKPLKVPVHDNVRFFIDKDNLVILDSDGKQRQAKIQKRELVSAAR